MMSIKQATLLPDLPGTSLSIHPGPSGKNVWIDINVCLKHQRVLHNVYKSLVGDTSSNN